MTLNAQLQSAASLHASGDLAGAEEIYRQVLAMQPDQVDALRLLGLVFAARGMYQQACEFIQKATALNPGFAAGHSSLGLVLAEIGRFDEAIVACRRALQLDPNLVGAHCGLGICLRGLGDVDGAIACMQKAISLNPNTAVAYSNLGPLLGLKGDLPGSIHCYRRVCQLLPNQPQHVMQLATALSTVEFSQFDGRLKADMLKCFAAEGVNYRDLAIATTSVLRLDPQLGPLLYGAGGSRQQSPGEVLSAPTVSALNDALLLQLLQKCVVPDRDLERFLTNVRAHMLSLTQRESATLEEELGPLSDFVYSLAQQCFFNEYVYAQSDAETAGLNQLERRVEAIALPLEKTGKLLLALYACYRPIHKLAIAADVAGSCFDEGDPLFREMVKDQIANPLAELKIRAEIPSLVTHKDQITESVQAQYEENPFPRWKHCVARTPGDFATEIKTILPHIALAPGLNCESPEILIAGCGTGWHAVNSSRTYKNARITAIDLSLSSLAYARRITHELGIDNIEYIHANILELDTLNKKFDLIECVGVLHHLSDPFRGWEILSGLLKENGLMMFGLYSQLARKAVVSGREFVASRGYPATVEGIRNCRQELFETEDALVRENIICAGSPFWTTSEVRDLIFHAMEYQYTIPELAATIESLGLEFLGFQHRDPGDKTRYALAYPSDPEGLSLANWHEYEQKHPRTFTGMYLFWVRK